MNINFIKFLLPTNNHTLQIVNLLVKLLVRHGQLTAYLIVTMTTITISIIKNNYTLLIVIKEMNRNNLLLWYITTGTVTVF